MNKKSIKQNPCEFSENYAHMYETIIMKANNCERNGVPEADADIYRDLLEAYFKVMGSNRDNFPTNKDSFDNQCKNVNNYLKEAADKLSLSEYFTSENTIHWLNEIIRSLYDKISGSRKAR